jgi:5'-nucleotidase
MMDRKTFLKYLGSSLAVGGMASILPNGIIAKALAGPFQPEDIDLTILYTNDTHSQVEPNSRQQGGIARRAALIRDIRSKHPHTLMLDAGDTFQGTPWYSKYGGAFQFRLMSKLGYQAMVLGNQEFDQGIERLAKAIRNEAKFPVLAANYDVSNTALKGLVQPFTVLRVNRARIGIFGLGIALQGLVPKGNYQGLRIRNPISVARGMVRSLRTYKNCDLVIGLSHLGYQYNDPKVISDRMIAERVAGIDIIIGGHTHTKLDGPQHIIYSSGWKTLVTQAGFGGSRLGKLDVRLSKSNKGTDVQI